MLSKEFNAIRHDLNRECDTKEEARIHASFERSLTNFYVRVSRITEDDIFNSYDIESEEDLILDALKNLLGKWGVWVSTLEKGM
jgi:hypothetical protein